MTYTCDSDLSIYPPHSQMATHPFEPSIGFVRAFGLVVRLHRGDGAAGLVRVVDGGRHVCTGKVEMLEDGSKTCEHGGAGSGQLYIATHRSYSSHGIDRARHIVSPMGLPVKHLWAQGARNIAGGPHPGSNQSAVLRSIGSSRLQLIICLSGGLSRAEQIAVIILWICISRPWASSSLCITET